MTWLERQRVLNHFKKQVLEQNKTSFSSSLKHPPPSLPPGTTCLHPVILLLLSIWRTASGFPWVLWGDTEVMGGGEREQASTQTLKKVETQVMTLFPRLWPRDSSLVWVNDICDSSDMCCKNPAISYYSQITMTWVPNPSCSLLILQYMKNIVCFVTFHIFFISIASSLHCYDYIVHLAYDMLSLFWFLYIGI